MQTTPLARLTTRESSPLMLILVFAARFSDRLCDCEKIPGQFLGSGIVWVGCTGSGGEACYVGR
ncbi:hypothetical protein BDR03DRAFT_971357 [Suillus americanus]|nr:hypothetical protein BDR03DRAFT_971357 [Suillus americanus]